MIKRTFKQAALLGFVVVLSACSSRYHVKQDKAPVRVPTELEMQDALVTDEAKSVSAGRPYEVLGKHYTPMSDEKGYQAEGTASWYGRKFHGYYTSNGEVFNMFDMTAAHKTLPLPSFVRVTNIENGKSAVVRVNDRGPFHEDRLIDLSYAAAYKLGFHHQGTAQVKIESITIARDTPRLTYVQVAAASNIENVQALASTLSQQFQLDTPIAFEDNLYKLRLGPITDDNTAQQLLETLRQGEFNRAFLLYTEHEL